MGSIRVTATPGTSMWSLWKALPKSQTKPGWEQFQHQFRVKNPEVGVNGYLEVNHTYTLPAEPESDATDTTAGGDPGTATVGAPGTMPTGLADGSSPAAAIPVTAAEAWAATGWNDLMKLINPDAFVIAARGKLAFRTFQDGKKSQVSTSSGKIRKSAFSSPRLHRWMRKV